MEAVSFESFAAFLYVWCCFVVLIWKFVLVLLFRRHLRCINLAKALFTHLFCVEGIEMLVIFVA